MDITDAERALMEEHRNDFRQQFDVRQVAQLRPRNAKDWALGAEWWKWRISP
jgi:hypothetical protein